MVRKNVFEEVNGFDENLSAAYSDVDFCLKIREAGYRIVWTPSAELFLDAFQSRDGGKNSIEAEYLRLRWKDKLTRDPFYNPNLTLRHEDLGYGV